jgi:hypothetical protein
LFLYEGFLNIVYCYRRYKEKRGYDPLSLTIIGRLSVLFGTTMTSTGRTISVPLAFRFDHETTAKAGILVSTKLICAGDFGGVVSTTTGCDAWT